MTQDLVKTGQWGAIYDRAPQSALCRQWTREGYIEHMEQVVAAEDAYNARRDAARAEREAREADDRKRRQR